LPTCHFAKRRQLANQDGFLLHGVGNAGETLTSPKIPKKSTGASAPSPALHALSRFLVNRSQSVTPASQPAVARTSQSAPAHSPTTPRAVKRAHPECPSYCLHSTGLVSSTKFAGNYPSLFHTEYRDQGLERFSMHAVAQKAPKKPLKRSLEMDLNSTKHCTYKQTDENRGGFMTPQIAVNNSINDSYPQKVARKSTQTDASNCIIKSSHSAVRAPSWSRRSSPSCVSRRVSSGDT
jgi:hypothetical protein